MTARFARTRDSYVLLDNLPKGTVFEFKPSLCTLQLIGPETQFLHWTDNRPAPHYGRCDKCGMSIPACEGEWQHCCPLDEVAVRKFAVKWDVLNHDAPGEPLGFFGTAIAVAFGFLAAAGIEQFVRWLA